MPSFRIMSTQPAFFYYGYYFFYPKKPAPCCQC